MKHVFRDVLPNGIKCYSFPKYNVNVSGIGFRVGSINDPPGKRGISHSGMAHLVEHLLCRESLKYPAREAYLQFRKIMGGVGGSDINIRTDKVSTFYGHGDIRRRRYMFTAFDLLASMLQDKIINQNAFDVEASAVLQEYFQSGIDDPGELVDDLLLQVIYETNPIRKRIDCEPEALFDIKLYDVRQFIRRYYVPKNMFVIMLGPKRDVVKNLAQKYFGEWSAKSCPILDYNHSDDYPKLESIKSLELQKPGIHQYHVQIGFPTENYGTKDAEGLDIIAEILNDRLFVRLREENRIIGKGVYHAACYTNRTYVNGLLNIWYATSSEDFHFEAEMRILQEIKNICENLVSSDEFEAVCTRKLDEYWETITGKAGDLSEMIIDSVCNGDDTLKGLHSFPQRHHKLTRRKIREIANKYLTSPYGKVVLIPN